jgi:hypothetical protein
MVNPSTPGSMTSSTAWDSSFDGFTDGQQMKNLVWRAKSLRACGPCSDRLGNSCR